MNNFFLLFLLILGLIVVLNAVLVLYLVNLKKRFDLLFEDKKTKNLKEIFLNQVEKIKKHELEFKELTEKIKKLEKTSEISFQKIGIIRFNPFNDIGGNQSFAIALLDSQNNGFVISSLFIKEGSRIYAKTIKNGKSDHPLSKEEKKALERATTAKF